VHGLHPFLKTYLAVSTLLFQQDIEGSLDPYLLVNKQKQTQTEKQNQKDKFFARLVEDAQKKLADEKLNPAGVVPPAGVDTTPPVPGGLPGERFAAHKAKKPSLTPLRLLNPPQRLMRRPESLLSPKPNRPPWPKSSPLPTGDLPLVSFFEEYPILGALKAKIEWDKLQTEANQTPAEVAATPEPDPAVATPDPAKKPFSSKKKKK
jgi:hypothetical protein